MAIEYYDSILNYEYHEYFLNKLNDLLSRNSIINFLDETHKQYNSNSHNLFSFDSEKLKIEIFPILNNLNHKVDLDHLKTNEVNGDDHKKNETLVTKNFQTSTGKKKSIRISNITDMDTKLKDLNINLNKLHDNLNSDINTQSSRFEELKKKKLEKLNEKKIQEEKKTKENNFTIQNLHKDNDVEINKAKNKIKYLNLKRDSVTDIFLKQEIQSMNKELKEYGEKHIFLLEKAINEIKEYHLQNLEGLDEETNSDIIDCLKEDMEAEIVNIRNNYEDLLDEEIKKIKKKYIIK